MWLLTACAVLIILWVATVFIRARGPLGFVFIFPRLSAAALSPLLAPVAAAGAAASALIGNHLAVWLFAVATGISALTLVGIMAAPCSCETVSATGQVIPAGSEKWSGARYWSRRWWAAAAADAIWERDVPFWTIPGTERVLLCDIWQPPAGTPRSGLAYIYFHGSAWYILDKDTFTRPLFRHLAAQGHVIMDVAYRLYPETDVPGMVGDVKRAIAWLKDHAEEYGVSADRIVIGGSSAGGHLCLLTAYDDGVPELTPTDASGRNLQVCGVISLYGPSDLQACFSHTHQERIPGIGVSPPDMKLLTSGSGRLGLHKASMAGRLDWLIGGTPSQVPERYALYSPVSHVGRHCPPTLLIQGEDDLITSATATRELIARLHAAGVPVASLFFPFTTHGFDLMLPALSPSARRAQFEVERFLAMLAA